SLSGSYELPFGRERQFGANWNRGIDTVLGGWGAAFALTAHSGYPITVQDGVRRSLQSTRSAEWPNRIGSGEVSNPTIENWLDINAFEPAALGTFGNAGVGILRAPSYWNLDFSLSKRITTLGRQYLMIRGEAFNVLNNVNFGPPARNIRSQNFG